MYVLSAINNDNLCNLVVYVLHHTTIRTNPHCVAWCRMTWHYTKFIVPVNKPSVSNVASVPNVVSASRQKKVKCLFRFFFLFPTEEKR
jgi:hypothetical protein